MIDLKCNLLEKGQQVIVPDPNSSDTHNHSFIGTVIDILDDRGTAIIEDQCGEYYEIEGDRLEINE